MSGAYHIFAERHKDLASPIKTSILIVSGGHREENLKQLSICGSSGNLDPATLRFVPMLEGLLLGTFRGCRQDGVG
jgi:hypothetical protein